MKNSNAYLLPKSPAMVELAPANSAAVISVKVAAEGSIKLLAALVGSALAGWCCTSMVSLAFDSGYQLIANLCGQPDSPQGVVAAMALWFAVLPFSCSFVFGWSKRVLKGSQLWGFAPAAGVLLVSYVNFLADMNLQSALEMAPWVAASMVFSYGAYLLAQAIAPRLDVTHKTALPIALSAFIPAGICVYLGLALNEQAQLVAYAVTMLLAAYLSTRHLDARKAAEAAPFSTVMLAAVLLPLAINVLANIASLVLDVFGCGAHLGWRAFASATFIFSGTIAVCYIGVLAGCARNRMIQAARRSLLGTLAERLNQD